MDLEPKCRNSLNLLHNCRSKLIHNVVKRNSNNKRTFISNRSMSDRHSQDGLTETIITGKYP